MLLYTNYISPAEKGPAWIPPRLAFMAQWLGMRLFGEPLKIITDTTKLPEATWILNYTNKPLKNINSFWIHPHSLLFETEITEQFIEVKHTNGLPYFFETQGHYHFDILAASFYLMQRYEEYLPHQKDMYGRYAHENSVAFKHHFLHLPLVDLWTADLISKLEDLGGKEQGFRFKKQDFTFLPTYDVDIAYSYKGKGFSRNLAGFIRSVGQWHLLKERWQVLINKQQDPFDIFTELDALHQQYNIHPLYFFLLADKKAGYDKNINPAKAVMQQLMQTIALKSTTGIHPSWQSGDDENLLTAEIQTLSSCLQKNISTSRQHYIRMQLPLTYALLIRQGITSDHSMGYGSINGFRASTSVPYYWYNLQAEKGTDLQIFPFCYMEANSIFEQKDTPAQALEELQQYYNLVKKVGGTLITIFHNHLIGLNEEGKKWMGMYRQFLAYSAEKATPGSNK